MSQRTLILIALALFALALYAAGLNTGSLLVIILGVCIELWFWYKLIVQRKNNQTKQK